MVRKKYQIKINSTVERVFDYMLGITDIKTYENWTSVFNESSTYEGSWKKNAKIHFIGVNENRTKSGMIARIVAFVPNLYVSIEHYGVLENDVEITEGPKVEGWAGCHENYTFKLIDNQVEVTVDVDVIPDHLDYFDTTYPKALELLGRLIETN